MVGSPVLARVDGPVEVSVSRIDGGAVWLGLAHDADARAAVGSSPFLSVDRVHYPSGGVDAHVTGAGASKASRLPGGDVWQQTSTGTGAARLVVQPSDVPQSVVATSGNAAALGRVRTTLTWQNQTWFVEALAVAAIGLVLAALAPRVPLARPSTPRQPEGAPQRAPGTRCREASVPPPHRAATSLPTQHGQGGRA